MVVYERNKSDDELPRRRTATICHLFRPTLTDSGHRIDFLRFPKNRNPGPHAGPSNEEPANYGPRFSLEVKYLKFEVALVDALNRAYIIMVV